MGSRILVVDDEAAILRALGRILDAKGHKAALANSGKQALALMEEGPYELLITDLKLPDADGMEITRHFKEKFPQSQAIILTGYPTWESAQQAAELDVYEYFEKPFEIKNLENAIEKCLALKSRKTNSYENKLVLLVEDSPSFSNLLETLCSLRGIPSISAMDGEEAMRRMDQNKAFDLLLIDIGLPGISGLELCRQLKNDPQTKHIPVILITATYALDTEMSQKAKEAGADLFIVKPTDPYELCRHMEKFLLSTATPPP